MTDQTRPLKYLFGDYIEWSIRYYEFDESVVTDEEFDSVCQTLLTNWDEFTHRLKDLTTPDALAAGTGYHISTASVPPRFVYLIRKYPDRALRSVFPESKEKS